MAIRLSVIMVQTPSPSAKGARAERIVEGVVGELIGRGGIDLTLIGPIAALQPTSTDRLTLDSLSGDVAILDWQPPDGIVMALAQIGFVGYRSPHPHDPDVSSTGTGGRRIYAFDLNRFASATEVIEALSNLLAGRQISTFSIGIAKKDGRQSVAKPLGKRVAAGEAARPGHSAASGQRAPADDRGADDSDAARPTERSSSADAEDLDDLLDQLDQLDP